jgi:hypothetical protein
VRKNVDPSSQVSLEEIWEYHLHFILSEFQYFVIYKHCAVEEGVGR